MNDPTTLNSHFSIPGVVKFQPGNGGLTRIVITSPAADAEIYLHGAHVTHFQPNGHDPVLFMSSKSLFSPDKPIRGGVPIIFPWFGPKADDSSAPAHGFARTLEWDVREVKQANGAVVIALGLTPSDATRRWLSNDFELIYTVSVGVELELSLEVRNRSSEPLAFEEALHTYFNIGDIHQVGVTGLSGRVYIDKPAGMQRKTQAGTIRFEEETDRVYLDTTETVTASDPAMKRRIVISKEGSGATVVWNPWIAKAKAMADFGDDEWPRMLCIETANAADNAISLPAGQSHIMQANISVEKM
jgi:glucose-6-phosphate 1-epimerase